MRRSLFAAVAVLAATIASSAVHAGTIISWSGHGLDSIAAVNDGAGTTLITGTDVDIDVATFNGVVAPFTAILNLDLHNIDTAVLVAGQIVQHYAGTFSITSGAGGTGTDYLSGIFTDAALGAGTGLTLTAANPPESVTFTSDLIPAADLAVPNAISFAFSAVDPPLNIVNGSFGSFAASQTGTASSSIAVPEPTALALLGFGLAGIGLVRRKNH